MSGAMILVISLPVQPRMIVLSIFCLLLFILPLFVCDDSATGLGVINIMEEGYNKTRPLSSIFNNSHEIPHPTARRRAVKYTNRRFLDGGWERRSNSPANMLSPDQMVQRIRYTSRRFLAANVCTNKDISITQSRDGSVGIPQYTVQIVNTCMSECAPSDIHVYCGWFASSPPPNPNTFTRVAYNDCLVNGGRALPHGSVIQFQYANSFMYPLRFKSANFCR